jgi:tetratricopeptide (TPR) repeat protein
MPAYAEFQVEPAPTAPEIEQPALASEEKAEISFELTEPAEIASSAPVTEANAEVAKQGQPAAEVPVEEFSLSPEPEEPEEIAALEPPSRQVTPEAPKAVEPPVEKKQVPEPVAAEKDHSKDKAKKPAEESEFELDQDYELVLEPESLVPAYDQKPPDVPIRVNQTEAEPAVRNAAAGASGESSFGSDQFMADLASEIEHLGMGQLTPPNARGNSEAPAKSIDASNQSDSGPLKEVFDDFRAELGEMGAEDEDLETHYNLGTAFREMGLLEEAISEFQKVAKANERGRPFRYAMQCCTLLGLAFMEKGQPAIAAIWYERALQTPGVEPESILALRYDLGIAQESAGEPEEALKSFSKVYAMNIDYRDVAERIAALQKPSR